jgi:two-component system, OmpR family, response regulator
MTAIPDMAKVDECIRSQRILVVDDEPSLVDALARSLRYEGFEVEGASNGRMALSAAQERPPDLIVLDVTLPDLDGLEVTRKLRRCGSRAPILFVADREDGGKRRAGLTIGGDAYMTKPFALGALAARVHAILRRIGSEPADKGILRFGDIEMNENTYQVSRAGQAIALTATEFRLLRLFLVNPGHVFSKSEILEQVWSYDFRGSEHIVVPYVGYLRKKLEVAGPPVINTIRLAGYGLW